MDVAADAVPGKRDIAFRRSVLPKRDRGLRPHRLHQSGSGIGPGAIWAAKRIPRAYQQFEAIAYQRGADGKPHTADDVELGPIDVSWSVEEFYSVYGDDDKEFVGTLSPTGLFTPASDGPNPQRKFSRNNYGDVWVVATAKNEKDKDGKPLSGQVVSGGDGSDVHAMGSAGGGTMTRHDSWRTARLSARRISSLSKRRAQISCIWCRRARFSTWTTLSAKLIDCLIAGRVAA